MPSGALQELTVTDEEYLAYVASTHLGQISATDVGALTATALGGSIPDTRLVGIYTDSYYPTSNPKDIITNKTALYQRRGFAPYNDPLRKPFLSFDRDTGALREMGGEALDILCERLLLTIMSNDITHCL